MARQVSVGEDAMNSLLLAKVEVTVGVVLGAGAAVIAVVDTSTQTAIIGLTSLGITSATALGLAWIAYKQHKLGMAMLDNTKTTDATAQKVSVVAAQGDMTASAVEVIQVVAEKTAEKVETVRKMTDGNLGEQLRIGMVAAQALYAVEPTSGNKELADAAKRKFTTHIDQLEKAALAEQQAKEKAQFDAGVKMGQEAYTARTETPKKE